jgi:two-component system, cell cycle response regulator
MRKEFEELKQSGQLPSPAGVGIRILTLTQEEECSLDELVATLQVDPALTGRILKLAASAQAASSMPVSSLKEAAMRLGLRTVTSVALGFSVISDDRPDTCPAFDYDLYWSASLACGLASQELSQRLGLATPAEAFTCALLSRIGQLALASCHPTEFSSLLDQVQRDPSISLRQLETDAFGIDHCEIAEAMLFEWGLPSAFGEVARSLEDENGDQKLDGYARELWRVIRDAAIIASLCMQGDSPSAALVDDLIQLRQRLEIMGVNLTEVCDAVLKQWVEWGAMLSLPTKDLASKLSPASVLGSLAKRREDHQALQQNERCNLRATGIRVLAVDDDPLSLRVLERLLKEAGHEVFTAKNGREALALTLKVRPQVVVTDWQMPDIDGLDFCRALRRSRFGRRIYLLLLTGNDNDEQILEAFEAGVDDYIVKPFKPRLFMARLRAGIRLVKLQEQVERDQAIHIKNATMMARMNRQLKEAANTDFLTHLPNRRCAMEQFQKEWRTALEVGSPLSVLMMDIDHFKTVNDGFGHDTGDAVLRETARVIKLAVRRNDTAARMGGEEFLVICPGADLSEAEMIGNRIRQRIEENVVRFGNFQRNVTISVGCAENLPGIQDIDHLLRLADEAVYVSKSSGRNRVSLASRPEPGQQAKSA